MRNIKCEVCEKLHRGRNVIYFKGKWICQHCRLKLENTRMNQRLPHYITKEDALAREYEIRPIIRKDGKILAGATNFHRSLIGYKFKISLIEDPEDKNKKIKKKK